MKYYICDQCGEQMWPQPETTWGITRKGKDNYVHVDLCEKCADWAERVMFNNVKLFDQVRKQGNYEFFDTPYAARKDSQNPDEGSDNGNK